MSAAWSVRELEIRLYNYELKNSVPEVGFKSKALGV